MRYFCSFLLLILSLTTLGENVDSLYSEGVKLARQGRYKEAKPIFKKVAEGFGKQEIYWKQAMALNDIAACDAERGFLSSSIEQLEEIQEFLHEKKVDSTNVAYAKTLFNLASNTYRLGNLIKAERYGKQCLKIMKLQDERFTSQLASVYVNLGVIQAALEDNSQSIGYYNKAADLYEKKFGPDHIAITGTLVNLAMRNLDVGNDQLAHDYLVRADHIIKNTEDDRVKPKLPNHYKSWGDYYNHLEQFDKAEEYYLKAIKSDSLLRGAVTGDNIVYLSRLAELHRDQGKIELVEKYAQKTIEIMSSQKDRASRTFGSAYNNLAWVNQQRGNLDQAISFINKSIESYSSPDHQIPNDPSTYLQSMDLKGELLLERYRKDGNRKDLEAAYELSNKYNQELNEFSRKLRVKDMIALATESHYNAYDTQMQIAFEGMKLDKEKYEQFAWKVIENTKGILHKLWLNDATVPQFAGIPQEVLEKGESLRSEYAYIKAELANSISESPELRDRFLEVSEQLESHLEMLQEKYPSYIKSRFGLAMADMSEAQKFARQENAAIISYLWGSENVFAVFFDGNSVKWLNLGKEDEIKNLCDQLRASVSERPEPDDIQSSFKQFSEASNRLYRILLEPMIAGLDREKLILIPDGALGFIPFDVLGPSEAGGFSEYPYLLKDYALQYGSSITTLIEKAENTVQQPDSILALAPEFSSGQSTIYAERNVGPLPGAKKEVESLANTFGQRVKMQSEIRREDWLQRKDNLAILHLATHAFVENGKPMRSAIAVSGNRENNEESMWLTAADLYNLKFKAGLVTLSACNTGMGDFNPGEGVMSLARSFQHNVSSNVIMSLWQVQDQATEKIMSGFYKSLEDGDNLETSLRRAKLDYLNDTDEYLSHPFFWSAWLLSGDGNNPLQSSGTDYSYYLWVIAGLLIIALVIYKVRS